MKRNKKGQGRKPKFFDQKHINQRISARKHYLAKTSDEDEFEKKFNRKI